MTASQNPHSDSKNSRRSKGIYLLPNLLTTAAMFSGFYALLAGFNQNFEMAAVALFVAMIFDGLDGRVARLTNTQSDFGVQYDSLSDMVSFGIAPAALAYTWALQGLGKLGWAAAFVYASCAALRLARFNVQVGIADKRYFVGIPSPIAAAVVGGMVWSASELDIGTGTAVLAAFITAATGLLMVSNFKYPSFKELDLRGRVPFVVIFAIAMGFVIITIDPARILFLIAIGYCFSAPLMWCWHKWRGDKTEHVLASDEEIDGSHPDESPEDLAEQEKID